MTTAATAATPDQAAQLLAGLWAKAGCPAKAPWKFGAGVLVRDALGLKRMPRAKWDPVFEAGEELGLFRVGEDILLPAGEGVPAPAKVAKKLEVDPEEDWAPPPTPANWVPRSHLDCGHWNYQSILKKAEECTSAEKSRLAKDYRGPRPMKTVFVSSPAECPACKAGKKGDPQHQKGEFRTPVPASQRRSAERQGRMGFQGLCCDSKGFYIGGVGNDCRHYHSGPERCAVHSH